MTKKTISGFLALMMFLMFIITPLSVAEVSASEITPRYNNVSDYETTASISPSGYLTVFNSFVGIEGITDYAVITTYVEKKSLGLFWVRVDIGTYNDEWVDTMYYHMYNGSHSVQLTSKGTYRVTAQYSIRGVGGSVDELEKTVEVKYE